jgi:enoyl-CoA hydratase
MELQDLVYEKSDGIAYVYLNRPKALNTFNAQTLADFETVQDDLFADESIRVVILAAKGKLFSAGIDISMLGTGSDSPSFAARYVHKLQEYYTRWEKLPMPVICAIHGVCIGGSIENALSCDMRVCTAGATFSLPELNMGMSPDMGGTQRLTRAVGPSQAKRLIMTADFIDAQEALRIGLVDFVVPDEELMDFATKLARRIADKPPLGVMVAKKAVNIAAEAPMGVGLQFEQLGSCFLFGTEDFKEGPRAFMEKRKPDFKGR